MKPTSKIGFILAIIIIGGIVFILTSCIKWTKYPPEPEIKFENYLLKDTTDDNGDPTQMLILNISFTDGDGDIGLRNSDTISPRTSCFDSTCNNLYINRYGIKNGESQQPLPINYRIPYITPAVQNKTLTGEIKIEMLQFLFFPYDTLVFDIYLYDRELNQSNVITTPHIVINN